MRNKSLDLYSVYLVYYVIKTIFYILISCFLLISGMYLIHWLIIEMPVLLRIKREQLYDRWSDR